MKNITLFLTAFCTLILPIKPLILIMVAMVFLDTITGIWTCIKIDGKKSFKSHKLFNIIPKIVFYSLAILISFLMDKYVFGEKLFQIEYFLSKMVCVIAVFIESVSINENSMKMGNKSIIEVIKNLITGLKGIKKDITELKK